MADFLVGRLLLDERQRAARLQLALLHVRERGDALPARRGFQLGDGDQLALEVMAKKPPVTHQGVGLALDGLQLPVVIQDAHERGVDDEQHRRADHAADERIVIADDRVLHGVRQQEQHDEIERVELRQFALARQPQPDEEKRIDDQRSNDLLAEADARLEERLPHVGAGKRKWGMGSDSVPKMGSESKAGFSDGCGEMTPRGAGGVTAS